MNLYDQNNFKLFPCLNPMTDLLYFFCSPGCEGFKSETAYGGGGIPSPGRAQDERPGIF